MNGAFGLEGRKVLMSCMMAPRETRTKKGDARPRRDGKLGLYEGLSSCYRVDVLGGRIARYPTGLLLTMLSVLLIWVLA